MIALEQLTISKILWNLNNLEKSYEALQWAKKSLEGFTISQGADYITTIEVKNFITDIQRELKSSVSREEN